MNQFRNDASYIEKVQHIYGDLDGELHVVELQRNGATMSLGLSLVGNRDGATMSVFVVGIEPTGLAGLDGRIHIGDELLEINGHVLYGRSHLNASAIIKGITYTTLTILLLRNNEYLQRMAVDPVNKMTIEYKDSSSTLIPKKPSKESISLDEVQLQEENESMADNDGDLGISPHVMSLVDYLTSEDPTPHEPPDVISSALNSSCDTSSKDNKNFTSSAKSDYLLKQDLEPSRKPKFHLKICTEVDQLNENGREKLIAKEFSSTTNDRWKQNHHDVISSSELSSDVQSFQHAAVIEDPSTCPINSGKLTVISIQKGKQALGLQIIGGSDTLLKSVYIFEIYRDGAASADGRLAVGDQILEANGEDLTTVTHVQALQILRRPASSLRMIVLRANSAFQEDDLYEGLMVDLLKKPGKGLGLSIVSKRDEVGVLISDIIKGGTAELDGRLMVGDEITSVNGDDVHQARQEYAAKLLKTVTGKVSLSIRRLKIGLRPVSLLGSAYINMCTEGSLRKSESHTLDCKSPGKQVTKSLSMSKSY